MSEQSRMIRKAYALADEIGLTRDDRIELAKALLWRDIESWKWLDDDQARRLLDALEGYEKITWLLNQRAPGRST
jgi:hypothetical protein